MTVSDPNLGQRQSPFTAVPEIGRLAIPITGCGLADAIIGKPPRTHVRRGEILVERFPDSATAPLAPADGRIAGVGVAKLTADLTVPAILFEPDPGTWLPQTPPPAEPEVIPAMLARIANLDLPQAINRLQLAGVWADRWTTPNLLGQLRAAAENPIKTLLCSALDESPDLLLHQELVMQFPVELVAGVLALTRLTDADEALIVLAAYGPDAAWNAVKRASADTSIRLISLRDHYPQAHPTLLIHELTGRHSRPEKLPVEAGVLALDAAAAIAIGRYFLTDTPMLSLPIGLRLRHMEQSHWLEVPVGMPWMQVLAHLDISDSSVELRAGNPLRELRLTSDCVSSGGEHCIVAWPNERHRGANSCIRCAWCVEGCPVHIQPAGLLEAAQQDDPYLADTYGMDACIECGICSYVCPSNLPILAGIRSLRGSKR